MATREAFLSAAAGQRSDHGRVRGRDAAEIPRGDRSFGGLPNVVAAVVAHAKLAVHEEFPDEVATAIKKFLRGA